MKLSLVLRDLHHHENQLAQHLLALAQRHRADHEIHHVGRDLAQWCCAHVGALAEAGDRYGLDLDPEPQSDFSMVGRLQDEDGRSAARPNEAELQLLHDLRHLCTDATGVRLDWETVSQAAQAARDAALLGLAQRCQQETERLIQWADGKLKESSPQILTT
ncbi:hypothetical protein ACH492_06070 [Streptomyces sp. NPDC019443]|uniref:hypothetical protein n=1 Tax=Streptomyces sp. NPDC019443 TaxID=3365061 RepID=UPI0037A7EA5A